MTACASRGCSDSRNTRVWRHRAETVLHDPHPLSVQAGKLRLVRMLLESQSQLGAKSTDVCANPLGQGLTLCPFDKQEGIAQHQERSWEPGLGYSWGWDLAGSPRLPPRSRPGRAAPPRSDVPQGLKPRPSPLLCRWQCSSCERHLPPDHPTEADPGPLRGRRKNQRPWT